MSAAVRITGATLALLGLGLCTLTLGCKSAPRMRYYVLEPRVDALDGSGDGATIGVLPFQVDPPYDQDRIVYRIGTESPQIGFYEYHRWAAPLSTMMTRLAAAVLHDVEGVGRIEPARSGQRYDVTLVGRVVKLEEVDSASGQHGHLKLVLNLSDAHGAILWSTSVSGRSTASADTVEGIVTRIREVAERALMDQREEIARVLASIDR